MADVFSCLDPECERDLIDCGDVWRCPECGAHWTYAALAVEVNVLDVARELAELL